MPLVKKSFNISEVFMEKKNLETCFWLDIMENAFSKIFSY